ncbi:tetratricopeptide repeat protein [Joostella sp. CR20]|uniref:tetratricopeptide repeat protein n=1 Tax=Joostella sp. CR20 TaxID=2804312 RepID=UPI00313CA570
MKLTNKGFAVLMVLGSTLSYAQESKVYTYDQKDYHEALDLYQKKQYQAAQVIFQNVERTTKDEETKANSAYYIANAAIRTNQLGADRLMEEFVETYPTSTKRNSAYMDVGDYYFNQAKYPNALRWYDMAEEQSMTNAEREAFNFKKGYSLFVAKKYTSARTYLEQVTTSEKYGSQAKYYIGYMAYEGDDYNEANQYFEQVSADQELSKNLSYYQADMNFKLGDFDKAIALGKEQLPTADRSELSELNKIIGESYFNKKEYEAAIPYLKQYQGKNGKWNNTDFYQLGYAYYKQGEYDLAINQFNKIVEGNNSVAQNAYYHLGECYLKTDKKQQALNAFRNASQMPYDEQIKKDASLNYARLSYEVGNPYESTPLVLTNYLETYPKSENTQEIQELLVDSYITSKNYDGALKLLETNKNYSSKTTYQKVAFYRGLELYNEGNYTDAKSYFEKSVKEQQDPLFTARAIFWNAEVDYLLENYDEAVVGFKQFEQSAMATQTPEYKNLDYNLAYTYFKQKDYSNSATYFKEFIDANPNDVARVKDSYLRMGDSQFAESKYWPAMEAYNKAIALGGADADYAHFQKAISYGFVDRNEKKITELEAFVNQFPDSPLRDDAFYELGNTYINNGQTEKGINAYGSLASNYRMSSFVPKAMLKEGLVYYNAGKNTEALSKFQAVVKTYPNTPEALQAVSTAKQVYVDEGRVNEYASWVKGLDFVNVTETELESATFESAERQYVQQKTSSAIKGLEAYLNEFPQGANALKAHFYLGQLYSKEGNTQKALPHYEYIVAEKRNEFSEEAYVRAGEIYLENKNYNKAITVLKTLEQGADFQQNIVFAQSNIMKASYELKNYPQTITYAEKVLNTPKIDDRIKSDAYTMIARSAIATGDDAKAKKAYAEVQKIATGALGAEALYYDAYFKHQEKNYEASNASAQKLAKDYSAYKETGGKGLIIMAKNFFEMDDAFQATYILQSVVDNFSQYPAIVEEAKTQLTIMKSREAERNSSVNPTKN